MDEDEDIWLVPGDWCGIGYFPPDSMQVFEEEEEQEPVLYGPNGEIYTRPKRRIGFDI